MNFETSLINDSEYNYQELRTVSERVFWHWAKFIGIIKESEWKQNKVNDNIYECNESTNNIIKCFGSIDAGNSLSTEFGIFNETYINIPTSYGNGKTFLKKTEDSNYKTIISTTNQLEGYDESPYMSYLGNETPIYDLDGTKTYEVKDTFDSLEIVKNISELKDLFENDINSYDDININIKNSVNSDFDFNAILLYYSVYDKNDVIKTSYATNLFGIIFLDKVQSETKDGITRYYINKHHKIKSTTEKFGTGYSFRVNIKTMSVYDNTDAVIQDNTTMTSVYSNDFSDVISQLNKAIDIMNTNVQVTQSIQNSYASIISYYDTQSQTIEDISTQLNAYIKGSKTSVIDTSVLYVNDIWPNKKNENNEITFKMRPADYDENFSNNYKNIEPSVVISDNGLKTYNIDSSTIYTYDSYVKIDNDVKEFINTDKNILEADTSILDYIFDANKLDIKIYNNDNIVQTINGESVKVKTNYCYINPNSTIFDSESKDKVRYLKNSEDNINYVGLIPFIVAYLQKLKGGELDWAYEYRPDYVDPEVTKPEDICTVKQALDYIIQKLDNIQ